MFRVIGFVGNRVVRNLILGFFCLGLEVNGFAGEGNFKGEILVLYVDVLFCCV